MHEMGIRVISFRKANSREANKYGKAQALIDRDGEVRELTSADLLKFKPAAEILPPSLKKKLGLRRDTTASRRRDLLLDYHSGLVKGT